MGLTLMIGNISGRDELGGADVRGVDAKFERNWM